MAASEPSIAYGNFYKFVASRSCVWSTFAHELGHNLNSGHNNGFDLQYVGRLPTVANAADTDVPFIKTGRSAFAEYGGQGIMASGFSWQVTPDFMATNKCAVPLWIRASPRTHLKREIPRHQVDPTRRVSRALARRALSLAAGTCLAGFSTAL